ncbi:MAG: hypothetical protein ACPGTO_03165 [Polaribacter sp.]
MKTLKLICFVLIFSTLISSYTDLKIDKDVQHTTAEDIKVAGNENESNDGSQD